MPRPVEAAAGQVELYLRWLDKYERQLSGNRRGIILCAGKKRETVEVLDLDARGIHVAEYLTEWPPRAARRVIVAWAGGPAADALLGLEVRRLAEVAIDALADLLGEKRARAHELVEACFVHDWQTDPFARGAYAHVLVGGATAPKRLARPIDGTLFFAGEHTVDAPGIGTVDGALASGKRAAREVAKALGVG